MKNLFAVSSGVVSLSARYATDPGDLAAAIRERLGALARAHALTLPKTAGEVVCAAQPTTLHTLIRTIMLPYEEDIDGSGARVAIHGPDVALGTGVVTNLALLLHEFATNAVKYGALSTADGTVDVASSEERPVFPRLEGAWRPPGPTRSQRGLWHFARRSDGEWPAWRGDFTGLEPRRRYDPPSGCTRSPRRLAGPSLTVNFALYRPRLGGARGASPGVSKIDPDGSDPTVSRKYSGQAASSSAANVLSKAAPLTGFGMK